jgi:rSAM/selenodomain-associated transferase 1
MRRLLIFLKLPTPGQVKTRLAASLGAEAASAIYRACAELTLERLGVWRASSTLYVDPGTNAGWSGAAGHVLAAPAALARARAWVGSDWTLARVRAWVGPGWTLALQEGRTLGERLAQATAAAFAGGARRVIVIGTDSPWLSAQDLQRACDALSQAEVALGPTEDGGYYLIGLARPSPMLFDGISWSGPRVCAETLQRAKRAGLRVHLLPKGYDVDHPEDVQRWLAHERVSGLSSARLAQLEALVTPLESPVAAR